MGGRERRRRRLKIILAAAAAAAVVVVVVFGTAAVSPTDSRAHVRERHEGKGRRTDGRTRTERERQKVVLLAINGFFSSPLLRSPSLLFPCSAIPSFLPHFASIVEREREREEDKSDISSPLARHSTASAADRMLGWEGWNGWLAPRSQSRLAALRKIRQSLDKDSRAIVDLVDPMSVFCQTFSSVC